MVWVSLDRKMKPIIECRPAALHVHLLGCRNSAQNLSDLDIRQVRHVERLASPEQARLYRGRGRRLEKNLKNGGRVDDDHRPSRSERNTRVGETPDGAEGRPASRACSSSIVGCSATRRISFNK